MNEKKAFIYNGISSAEYGVLINGAKRYKTAERDFENVSVPGMNGDLTFDNGRFKNVTIEYTNCGIVRNFEDSFREFVDGILSGSMTGYKRLEDTYNSDEFRLAKLMGEVDPEMFISRKAGSFNLSFDCKPQRFLKNGENPVTLTSSGSITNPTHFKATPLIRVYGTGRLTIGAKTLEVFQNATYTDIDCDLMNCYCDDVNLNRYVSVTGNDFPVLEPGANIIQLTGISRILITPRWWRI